MTSLPFSRGAPGGVGVPFFGNNFEIWDSFWDRRNQAIDYAVEVGDLRTSALLMAAYTWVSGGLSSARLTVVRLDSDNKETEIQDHPLVALFDQPNPYYGSEELLAGIALDWLIYSTAYVLKFRNRGTGISQLWYEPCETIRPVWPADNSVFISGYEVNRDGLWIPVALEDVFVLRKGIDMATRMGQSPTSALLREYYTDRQAAEFGALLMKQGLVPPLVAVMGDKDRQVSADEAGVFKNQLGRAMSGAKAGEPVVTSAPTAINTLAYDYGKVGLRDVRALPEERFCSAMGISPYSLHFGTSRAASTFSNVENYLKHDYAAYIVPLHKYIAKRMARELLPEFGDTTNLQVRWNYDDVALMQANVNEVWTRVVMAYRNRVLDQAQALEALSYKPLPEQTGVYYPVPAASTSEDEPEDVPAQLNPTPIPTFTDMPAKSQARLLAEDGMQEDELAAGRDWWRRRAPRVAEKLIDAPSNGHGQRK